MTAHVWNLCLLSELLTSVSTYPPWCSCGMNESSASLQNEAELVPIRNSNHLLFLGNRSCSGSARQEILFPLIMCMGLYGMISLSYKRKVLLVGAQFHPVCTKFGGVLSHRQFLNIRVFLWHINTLGECVQLHHDFFSEIEMFSKNACSSEASLRNPCLTLVILRVL